MGQSYVSDALLVSIVGMGTVFFVLFLLVVSSQLLIRIVNHFDGQVVPNTLDSQHNHEKIIRAAIEKWSKGKAEVDSIQKY